MRALFLITFFIFSFKSFSFTLNVVTELFPAYQYLDKSGKLSGPTVEIVKNVLGHANIDYKLTYEPWNITYNALKRNPDTCVFSIGRNNEREDMFNWVFPVGQFTSSFYALKSRNINLEVLEDALKYRTAVIRNNFSHQYLKEHGFTEQYQLVVISSFNRVLEILETRKNQLDLVVLSDSQVQDASLNNKLMTHLEPVLQLDLQQNNMLYFACNKQVPDYIIKDVVQSYDSLYKAK